MKSGGRTRSNGLDAIDVEGLPNGVVTGSQMIAFPDNASAELRSSITLSLLAAQRVAANDPVVQSPDQWIQRHNTVLGNLHWTVENGGLVDSHFKNVNLAVHEAILPFLTTALGGAAGAGALIIKVIEQLNSMDENAPWITLFDRESRRFDVNEYHFSVLEMDGQQVRMKSAAARFDASYGRTQVLFFTIRDQSAHFEAANSSLTADAEILAAINGELKTKLGMQTKRFIANLPDNLLK